MTSITLAPLSSRIMQRLPGARSLEAHATETVEVCGAEDQPLPPAVFPAGELERITGVHEFSAGLDDELKLATCDRIHHTPTLAMRCENVVLAAGQLCNRSSIRRLTFRRLPFAPAKVTDIAETVAFCSTAAGNDYFAHFLLDDAPTALLGKNFGKPIFGGSLRPRTAQMRDYLQFCDVPYQEYRAVRFRDLWLFTDHAQNSHRRARLQQLRERLRDHCNEHCPPAQNAAPAYLRRGSSGSRRALRNEAEIESRLSQRGFSIIDPESMSTEQLCRRLNQSPLVVGVEGSQLAHAILNLRPRGGLLCIQPAVRFNAVYRSFCNSLQLQWGFVVAEGTAGEFHVSTERLLATLDSMLEDAA